MADLKAKWKNKGKEELHCFCQNIKVTENKPTLKGTTRMARLRGSARKKWIVMPLYQ
jgi:hypothetical protein